ncbi:MAG: hypothetical protein ACK6A8_18355 [Planctomycetota bacterium]
MATVNPLARIVIGLARIVKPRASIFANRPLLAWEAPLRAWEAPRLAWETTRWDEQAHGRCKVDERRRLRVEVPAAVLHPFPSTFG